MTIHRFALALLAASSVGAAHADNGTVSLSGSIGASSCGLTPSALNVAVDLGKSIDAGQLAIAGNTTTPVTFKIDVTACYSNSGFAVTFDPNGANVDANGRLMNTVSGAGAASNVVVELVDTAGVKAINIKSGLILNGSIDQATGTGALLWAARLYATGAATAGNFATSIPFTVTYQ